MFQIMLRRIWPPLKSLAKPDLVGWFCVALGIGLRLRQYLENLSLSGDEASLARNIVDRNYAGLTQTLDYNQGAPLGFLFIEKALIGVLGQTELVLRLFPVLASLLAMVLLYLVVKQFFGVAGLFAVLAFAISGPLIFYSAYLKPYSSDVMFLLLLLYLAGRCLSHEAGSRDFILLGLAGIAAIWISHPSVFALPGIGLVLALAGASGKRRVFRLWSIGLGVIWLVAFGFNYVLALQNLTGDSYLQKYWQDAFVPLPPWSNPAWFAGTYLSLLSVTLGSTDLLFAFTSLVLLLLGCAALVARSRQVTLLILSPAAMAFAAAILHKYPLADRLMLFLVPCLLLLMAEGFGLVYGLAVRWNRVLSLLLGAVILYVVLWHAALSTYRGFRYPTRPWDLRPVMEHIREDWRPSDIVYISGGGQASYYYAGYYGLDRGQVIMKTEHRIISWRKFRRVMGGLAGNDRVWVVFAHFESPKNERYVKFLHHIGSVRDVFVSQDARALLVDLNP